MKLTYEQMVQQRSRRWKWIIIKNKSFLWLEHPGFRQKLWKQPEQWKERMTQEYILRICSEKVIWKNEGSLRLISQSFLKTTTRLMKLSLLLLCENIHPWLKAWKATKNMFCFFLFGCVPTRSFLTRQTKLEKKTAFCRQRRGFPSQGHSQLS